MITERDFVLNYVLETHGKELPVSIEFAKQAYKMICENTSDINDDSFWLTGYERIRFSDITKVSSLGDQILEVKCIGMLHQLFGDDMVKFKQWFERKRG